ncbi:hypothetical protein HDU93_001142 [Gonapodya sp. JEL0774]|nr:hypothetical protein HDU93_001142 [Gonapodya sp. JEL0774]
MTSAEPAQRQATCDLLVRTWGVQSNGQWGTLTEPNLRTWWTENNCVAIVAAEPNPPVPAFSDTAVQDTCIGLQAIYGLTTRNSVSSIGILTWSYAFLGCNVFVTFPPRTSTTRTRTTATTTSEILQTSSTNSRPQSTTSSTILQSILPAPVPVMSPAISSGGLATTIPNMYSTTSSVTPASVTNAVADTVLTSGVGGSESRNNTPTIVGSVVGVVCALLLIAGLSFFVVRRRRRKHEDSATWSLSSTGAERPDRAFNAKSGMQVQHTAKTFSSSSTVFVSSATGTDEPGLASELSTVASPIIPDKQSILPQHSISTTVSDDPIFTLPVRTLTPLSAHHAFTMADPFSGPDPGETSPSHEEPRTSPFQPFGPASPTTETTEYPFHGGLVRAATEDSVASTPQMITDAFRKAMRAGVVGSIQHSASLEQMLTETEDEVEEDAEEDVISLPPGGSGVKATLSEDEGGTTSEASLGRRSNRDSWLVKKGRRDRRVVVVPEGASGDEAGVTVGSDALGQSAGEGKKDGL